MKATFREIIVGLIIAILSGVIVAWIVQQTEIFAELPTPTPTNNQTTIIVYPVCQCEEIVNISDNILVRLRWGATTKELAQEALTSVTYRLSLDGKPVNILQEYQQQPVFVSAEDNPRSPKFGDGWWIYWDVPIGQLEEGDHIIETQWIILSALGDGKDTYLPGAGESLLLKIHAINP